MIYYVESGDFKKCVSSVSVKNAALDFLKKILEELGNVAFGMVIYVTQGFTNKHNENTVFLNTQGLLSELGYDDEKPNLKLQILV